MLFAPAVIRQSKRVACLVYNADHRLTPYATGIILAAFFGYSEHLRDSTCLWSGRERSCDLWLTVTERGKNCGQRGFDGN